MKLICFAEEDWDLTGKRVQHLAWELSQRNEVKATLFVNPPVSHSFVDVLQRRFAPSWSQLPRHLYWRTLAGLARRSDGKVVTYTGSDKVIPLTRLHAVSQSGLLNRLNMAIYTSRIGAKLKCLPGRRTIVWASHAIYAPITEFFQDRDLLIYDWMDDWEQFQTLPTKDVDTLREMNTELVRRADIVLTVSENLFHRARMLNPSAYLVPNGTHFERFSQPELGVGNLLKDIQRPRLGYTGRIGDRIDFSLLEQLALQRREWSIVLVGPVWENVKGDASRLGELPNVHFLGMQPYSTLPSIISDFDVCLIPHTVDQLTASMDPIKLYDYLATGKPIVTTRVAGVDRFSDAIYTADSLDEFVASVHSALEESGPGPAERRKCYAQQNTWEARANEVWNIICAKLTDADFQRLGSSTLAEMKRPR